jgi:hypothetical protein
MKCTKDNREAITAAASGDGLRALGMRGMSSGAVVEWNTDGSHIMKLPEQSVELICCSMHSGLFRIVVYK